VDILNSKNRLELYYEIEEIMEENKIKYIQSKKIINFLNQDNIDFEIFQDGMIKVINKDIKPPYPDSMYLSERTLLYLIENNLEELSAVDIRFDEIKKDIKVNDK
jgi:hypothetical protein